MSTSKKRPRARRAGKKPDEHYRSLTAFLSEVLKFAQEAASELKQGLLPPYRVDRHLVQADCRVIRWMAGPLCLGRSPDPAALASYGLAPQDLLSYRACNTPSREVWRALEALVELSGQIETQAPRARRPSRALVKGWERATEAIVRAVRALSGQRTAPELDADRLRVRVEGTWYDITDEQADVLRILFEARGAWILGKNLGRRPDKTIGRTPPAVRMIIESHPRKGYRIPSLLPV